MATPDTIVTSIYDQPINAVQIEVYYATSFTINNPTVFLSSSPTKEKILASAGYPTSWAVFNCTYLGSDPNDSGQTVLHAIIRFTEKPITVFLGPPGAKGSTGNTGNSGGLNGVLNIGNTTGLNEFSSGKDIIISTGDSIKTADTSASVGINLNIRSGSGADIGGSINIIAGPSATGGDINLIPGSGELVGTVHVQGTITIDGFVYPTGGTLNISGLVDSVGLVLSQQASSPFTPPTSQGTVWVKNTSPTTLYFTNSAGADHELGFQNTTSSGITASTTQTQGNGALTSDINQISVVANPNDTVTLPSAQAGKEIIVINSGANTLKVFPASGNNLGAGVNNSTTQATNVTNRYIAYDTTNWVKV
jgi:hypothetical protein